MLNTRWKRAPLRYPKTDSGKKRITTISTASPRRNTHIGPAYGNSIGSRPSFTSVACQRQVQVYPKTRHCTYLWFLAMEDWFGVRGCVSSIMIAFGTVLIVTRLSSHLSTYSKMLRNQVESSRRDLHNALLCTVLQSQNFSQKSSTFFRD